jgi:hypothetical protein
MLLWIHGPTGLLVPLYKALIPPLLRHLSNLQSLEKSIIDQFQDTPRGIDLELSNLVY